MSRGYSPIKVTGVLVVPFTGLNLVPLRVVKPKMTAARVVSIPFREIRLHLPFSANWNKRDKD